MPLRQEPHWGMPRHGGAPHRRHAASGLRVAKYPSQHPTVRLSCQRSVTKRNPRNSGRARRQPTARPGYPRWEPRPRPSSTEYGHLYRLNTTAFAAGNGATASACQARALLTAIAPAPRSARIPAVPPRIAASLPVFASPWEGAGLLGAGLVGTVGVTTVGVSG